VAQLRLLREKFPNELVIISVHSAKFPTEKLTSNIREAVMRHGLDHPVVNDVDFQVWQSYAVKAWPTLVVIDPQGKIVHTQSGEILAEEFAPQIAALISKFEGRGLLDRTPLDLQTERVREPLRPLDYPAKVLLTDNRVLYIADTGHHRILEVQLGEDGLKGEITRVFGSGRPGLQNGPAATAAFHGPHGLALNVATLYVVDTENHAVRAIDLPTGMVRLVAGTGHKAHGHIPLGEPVETPLRSPWALLTVDDIVFIAMAGMHQIWALFREEQIGPFFGNGREALVDGDQMQSSFNQPSDLSMGMGYMFVADSEASAIRAITLLEEKPRVVTLVGQGLFEYGDVDGMGSMVRLQHPTGLTFYEGLVYIADTYNHKIKTLDPTTGQVKTLIGTGQPGHADGAFGEAELFEPEGVVAGNGRLYIADTNNHLVRVADLASRRLHTLILHGLERLQPVMNAEARPPDLRYDPLLVMAGQVTLYLDIELPVSYKLNSEAPLLLRVHQNGASTGYSFEPGEVPCVTPAINSDQELTFDLTLYYCETGEERLCLIHDARFVLPCLTAEAGPAVVRVPYRVA
jgi:DNA-binding beta-propeller fold protein YncE